jgi:hypothetical protein
VIVAGVAGVADFAGVPYGVGVAAGESVPSAFDPDPPLPEAVGVPVVSGAFGATVEANGWRVAARIPNASTESTVPRLVRGALR